MLLKCRCDVQYIDCCTVLRSSGFEQSVGLQDREEKCFQHNIYVTTLVRGESVANPQYIYLEYHTPSHGVAKKRQISFNSVIIKYESIWDTMDGEKREKVVMRSLNSRVGFYKHRGHDSLNACG